MSFSKNVSKLVNTTYTVYMYIFDIILQRQDYIMRFLLRSANICVLCFYLSRCRIFGEPPNPRTPKVLRNPVGALNKLMPNAPSYVLKCERDHLIATWPEFPVPRTALFLFFSDRDRDK